MKAKTKAGATKRLADLKPGDTIIIDRGGHTAVVEVNKPEENLQLRSRGYFYTFFLMDNGKRGGWTGRADAQIEVVATGGAS